MTVDIFSDSETARTDFWTWVGFKAPVKEQRTQTHQFIDLSIAFEVDLKLLEETAMTLNDAWHKAFESTGVFANTPPGNRVFRHLLLNITSTFKQHYLLWNFGLLAPRRCEVCL